MEMDDFRLRMRKEIKEDMEVSSLRVLEVMMKWKIDFGIETEDSVPIFDGQQLMHRVSLRICWRRGGGESLQMPSDKRIEEAPQWLPWRGSQLI